jgi:ribosomal-protein-alanine N-acetyltransferase
VFCPEIHTARLALAAITPPTLHAERDNNHRRLGNLIEATIPANWPPEHWEPHVLAILLEQFARHPDQSAWHRYILYRHPNGARTLIGALGAFWREAAPHECEIGYSVLPPYEGQGLATEAAQALIQLLRNDDHIHRIVAHTFPSLPASIRIMEKCGLTCEGPGAEEGTIRYSLKVR